MANWSDVMEYRAAADESKGAAVEAAHKAQVADAELLALTIARSAVAICAELRAVAVLIEYALGRRG